MISLFRLRASRLIIRLSPPFISPPPCYAEGAIEISCCASAPACCYGAATRSMPIYAKHAARCGGARRAALTMMPPWSRARKMLRDAAALHTIFIFFAFIFRALIRVHIDRRRRLLLLRRADACFDALFALLPRLPDATCAIDTIPPERFIDDGAARCHICFDAMSAADCRLISTLSPLFSPDDY